MGKRVETDYAPFIIQEQQAEWVNAQRQIMRPLSFRNNNNNNKALSCEFGYMNHTTLIRTQETRKRLSVNLKRVSADLEGPAKTNLLLVL